MQCNRKCKELDVKYEFPSEGQVQKCLSLMKQLEGNKAYAELVKVYQNIVLYYHSKGDDAYKSYLQLMRDAIRKRDTPPKNTAVKAMDV